MLIEYIILKERDSTTFNALLKLIFIQFQYFFTGGVIFGFQVRSPYKING